MNDRTFTVVVLRLEPAGFWVDPRTGHLIGATARHTVDPLTLG
jgi:hypothetical protein